MSVVRWPEYLNVPGAAANLYRHCAFFQQMGTFASVKPYSLRSVFHALVPRYPPRMGSYPRREKAEREARERAALRPALDCQTCGALTLGARFRYCGDRLICEACNQQQVLDRTLFRCAGT
jgi:hypothetical protein